MSRFLAASRGEGIDACSQLPHATDPLRVSAGVRQCVSIHALSCISVYRKAAL